MPWLYGPCSYFALGWSPPRDQLRQVPPRADRTRLRRLSLILSPIPRVTLRRALVAALKADPNVTAIVGNAIYPLRLPQKPATNAQTSALPAVRYEVTSIDRQTDLSGTACLASARVRLVALSLAMADCEELAEAFRSLLQAMRGHLVDNFWVLEIQPDDEADSDEDPPDGSDDATFMISVAYVIRFQEFPPR